MNKKNLALFFIIFILTAGLTGCMQYKVVMNVNNNSIDKAMIQIAFNKSYVKSLDEDAQEYFEFLLEEIDETYGDVEFYDNLVVRPLSYEENGFDYIGNSYEFMLEEDIQFPEEGNESLKIIPLNNNTYRLEAVLKESISQESIDQTIDTDIKEIEQELFSWGGKILFAFTTNNKVLSHNADEVVDGEYIWDITSELFNDPDEKIIAFVEYKVAEEAYVRNTRKEDFIKQLNIDPEDPDFYGKALQSVNVLYGTDKGLDLDSELIRLQGALVYARLLGLGEKISEFAQANPDYDCGFTDVPDWAKPTINCLYYNKLVYGKGNNLYGSYDPMSEAEFTALVLRALGYSEANKDFVFVNSPQKAVELGFYITDNSGYTIKNRNRLTRRDMSYIAFNSLFIQDKEKNAFLVDRLTNVQ
ncbi:MAG: hypothetical protein ACOYIF_06225 [Acetivibrionales bacterium]|jgi:hypothetical protein